MRDLKIKPGMDTPKAKLKNPAPKDANSILKKHMDKRQREKEPESRDPVRYATDRVEKNMRRGASGAADASRRMIKHYRGKLRQGKENAIRTHSTAETPDRAIGSESVFIDTPMEYAFSPVQTAARNEVGNRTISPQNCGGPKSENAAPQERGRQNHAGGENRLSAEPCREKNSGAAHCTSTVRPWRYNDPSAERQFGRIGQGRSCPKERTGHDQVHAHHACSTN